MRFESRLRPTQGIPTAAMMNLVLLLVFHLVAFSWQATTDFRPAPQRMVTQSDTTLTLELTTDGVIRLDSREVPSGELRARIADRCPPGKAVHVEVGCPATMAPGRLGDVLRALHDAGVAEILLVPSSESDR